MPDSNPAIWPMPGKSSGSVNADFVRYWLISNTLHDKMSSTSLSALFNDFVGFVGDDALGKSTIRGLNIHKFQGLLFEKGYSSGIPVAGASSVFVHGLRLRAKRPATPAEADSLQVDACAPAPLFPCAMIDIESASLHPGAALCFSLGVQTYRLTPKGAVLGPGLMVVFNDLAWQIINLRRVDADTQKFWFGQPKAASAHFIDPNYQPPPGVTLLRTSLLDLADHLRAFLDQHCTPDREILSQGIGFDVSNLAAAMVDAGRRPPWLYNKVVDARSLRNKMPKRRTAPKLELPAAAHDPIHDAIKQVWGVWEVATDEMLGIGPAGAATDARAA